MQNQDTNTKYKVERKHGLRVDLIWRTELSLLSVRLWRMERRAKEINEIKKERLKSFRIMRQKQNAELLTKS